MSKFEVYTKPVQHHDPVGMIDTDLLADLDVDMQWIRNPILHERMMMSALNESLRKLGDMAHNAADHVEAGTESAAAFNWQALFALLLQILPLIPTLFGGQPTPTPPPVPKP